MVPRVRNLPQIVMKDAISLMVLGLLVAVGGAAAPDAGIVAEQARTIEALKAEKADVNAGRTNVEGVRESPYHERVSSSP